MNWQTAGITFVGSVISWVAFALCGYVWGKRRLLEFWKRERAKLVAEIHAATVVQRGNHATATSQFAGSGLKVNLYGASLSNAAGLSGAVSWSLPRSTDRELQRLTAIPAETELGPIPFPDGWKPVPATRDAMRKYTESSPLPKLDALIWAYTAAEKQALAAVFTPGIPYTNWIRYRNGWDSYLPELTWRSPAKEEDCLAYWWVTTINGRTVGVVGNNLHMATDSTALPLRRFWGQIITEGRPELVIDTGTCGGVGSSIQVGDVVVATGLRFDCQQAFKDEPWATQQFPVTAKLPSDWSQALKLIEPNWGLLAPQTTSPCKIVDGVVLTTDFFAEDTANDQYGLRAFEPNAAAVEMDASVLGLVAQDLGDKMPAYCSIRSVSDPQMPAGSSEAAASSIYLKFGGKAQDMANCAVLQVIAAPLSS